MRTLVIGDIHGNIRSLEEVLKRADFDHQNDRLICVGDYVDGWKDVVQVVDLLLDIQRKSPFNNIYLMGNHDAWMVEAMNEGIDLFRNRPYIESKYLNWMIQGGDVSYASYLGQGYEKWKDHKIHFFDQLKPYHIERNTLFIHAGFDPDIGFDATLKNDPHVLLWNRSLFESACRQWDLKSKGQLKEEKHFDGFDKIYIGHTPTIKFGLNQPVKMGNVINVDQGCKVDGRLTIWIDESDTYFQAPPLLD